MIEKTAIYEIVIGEKVYTLENKKTAKKVAESLKILYGCDKVIVKETITKTTVTTKEHVF